MSDTLEYDVGLSPKQFTSITKSLELLIDYEIESRKAHRELKNELESKLDNKTIKEYTASIETLKNKMNSEDFTLSKSQVLNSKVFQKNLSDVVKSVDTAFNEINKKGNSVSADVADDFIKGFNILKGYSLKLGSDFHSKYEGLYKSIETNNKREVAQALASLKNNDRYLKNIIPQIKEEIITNKATAQYESNQMVLSEINEIKLKYQEKIASIERDYQKQIEQMKSSNEPGYDQASLGSTEDGAQHSLVNIDELNKAREELQKFKDEAQEYKRTIDELQKSLDNSVDMDSYHNLVGQVEDMSRQIEQLEILKQKLKEYEEEIEYLHGTSVSESYHDSVVDRLTDQIIKAEDRISVAQDKIEELQAKLDDVDKTPHAYSDEYALGIEKDLDAANEKVNLLERQLKEYEEEASGVSGVNKGLIDEGKRIGDQLSNGGVFSEEQLSKFSEILEDVARHLNDIKTTLGTIDDESGVKNLLQTFDMLLGKLDAIGNKVGTGVYNVEINNGSSFGTLTDSYIDKTLSDFRSRYQKLVGLFGDEDSMFARFGTRADALKNLYSKDVVAGIPDPKLQIDRMREFFNEFRILRDNIREVNKIANDELDRQLASDPALKNVSKTFFKERMASKNTTPLTPDEYEAYSKYEGILNERSLINKLDKFVAPGKTNARMNLALQNIKKSEIEEQRNIASLGKTDLTPVIDSLSKISDLLQGISEKEIFDTKTITPFIEKLDEMIEKLSMVSELSKTTEQAGEVDIDSKNELDANAQLPLAINESETKNINELRDALKTVIEYIQLKNELFQKEGEIVAGVTQNEITNLTVLAGWLSQIVTEIENIGESYQKNVNFESVIDLEGIDKFINKINKIDPDKLGEKFTAVYSWVDDFVKAINETKVDPNSLFGVLNSVSGKAEELKAVATIIKASKEQIEKAKNAVKSKDSDDTDSDRLKKLIKLTNERYAIETKIINLSRGEHNEQDIELLRGKVSEILNAEKQYKDLLSDEKNLNEYNVGVLDKRLVLEKAKKKIQDDEESAQSRIIKSAKLNYSAQANLLRQINAWVSKNSLAYREYGDQIDALLNKINGSGVITRDELDQVRASFNQITADATRAGKTGMAFFDILKSRFKSFAAYMATFASGYRLISLGKQLKDMVRDYDTALTEMRKVSEETVSSLKSFQHESFGIADSVGSTALTIQKSTADWMRLGESLEQAKESAKDASVLLNVSEFSSIEDATTSLVAMSQAYSEFDKMDIIDKLNNIGNNFSISTDQLAVGLQNAAAVLKTQGNDIDQSIALLTAANSVVQDISKASAGIRTISLRISGTEEAKQELQDLGEDVDDFVVQTRSKTQKTIKDYTATASNPSGIDVLDNNGNLRNTYDILLDISKVYKQIQEDDKKAGTNRANALVEYLAGKNRSNIAASVLNDPALLERVYTSSQNSAGSAKEENDKYLDSIEGRLNRLNNKWQEIWASDELNDLFKDTIDLLQNVLDSGAGEKAVSVINKIVDGLDEVIEHTELLSGAITALVGVTAIKGAERLIKQIRGFGAAISEAAQTGNAIKDIGGITKKVSNYKSMNQMGDLGLYLNTNSGDPNNYIENSALIESYRQAIQGLSAEQAIYTLQVNGATEAQARQILGLKNGTIAISDFTAEEAEAAIATTSWATADQVLTAKNRELVGTMIAMESADENIIRTKLGLVKTQTGAYISTKALNDQMVIEAFEAAGLSKENAVLAASYFTVERAQTKVISKSKILSTASGLITKAFTGIKIAFKSNPFGTLLTAASVITTVIMPIVEHFKKKNQELDESIKESTESYNDNAKSLSNYKDKVRELKGVLDDQSSTTEDVARATAELYGIQKDLIGTYGSYASGIDLVNGKLATQLGYIDEINNRKLIDWRNEIGDDKLDDIVSGYENYDDEFSLSSIDAPIRDLINSFDAFKMEGTSIAVSGSVDDVKSSVVRLQMILKDLGYTENELLNKNLQRIARETGNIVKSTGDTYQTYLMSEVFNDDQLRSYYTTLSGLYQDFQDSIKTGDTESINAAKESLLSEFDIISNSGIDEKYIRYFQSIYSDLSAEIQKWNLQKQITDSIEGTALSEYLKSNTLEAIQLDLQKVMTGVDSNEVLEDYFIQLSKYADDLDISLISLIQDLKLLETPKERATVILEKASFGEDNLDILTALKEYNEAIEKYRSINADKSTFSSGNVNLDEIPDLKTQSITMNDSNGVEFSLVYNMKWIDPMTKEVHDLTPEEIREYLTGILQQSVDADGTVDFKKLFKQDSYASGLYGIGNILMGGGYSKSFDTESYEEEANAIYDRAKALDNLYNIATSHGMTISDAINLSSKWGMDSILEFVNDIEKRGDLEVFLSVGLDKIMSAETLDDVLTLIDEAKKLASQDNNTVKIVTAVDAVDSIDDAKSAITSLNDLYQQTVENQLKLGKDKKYLGEDGSVSKVYDTSNMATGFADPALINSVESAFKGIAEDDSKVALALSEFEKTLVEFPGDAEKAQTSINELITAYIDQTNIIKNLKEENAEWSEEQLTAMGITNAHEVVISRLNKQVKETSKNIGLLADAIQKYDDKINNGEDGSEQFAKVISTAREALKMQDADGNWYEVPEIDDSFIERHMEDVRAMAAGDVEALNRIRVAAAKDAVMKVTVNVPADVAERQIQSLMNMVAQLDSMNIEVGANVNDSAFIASLNEMIKSGKYTADQVNAAFESMGYEVHYKSKEVKAIVPSKSGTHVTALPSNVPGGGTTVSWDWETREVPISIPEVDIVTKKSSGGMGAGAIYGGSPSVSSGGSGGGGGGDNSNKVQKESDETFDWIEVAIKRIEEEMARLDKVVNNTYDMWGLRNDKLASELEENKRLLQAHRVAYEEYLRNANAVQVNNGRGLDDDEYSDNDATKKANDQRLLDEARAAWATGEYQKKVREGLMSGNDIENIQNHFLSDTIKNYQEL